MYKAISDFMHLFIYRYIVISDVIYLFVHKYIAECHFIHQHPAINDLMFLFIYMYTAISYIMYLISHYCKATCHLIKLCAFKYALFTPHKMTSPTCTRKYEYYCLYIWIVQMCSAVFRNCFR